MEVKFSFHHVTHAVGIPESTEMNWPIGQIISGIARRRGVRSELILTEKTDPSPTVDAPHGIAHYDMKIFKECIDVISVWWGDRARQLIFFKVEAA
jgi:hypothetical protein